MPYLVWKSSRCSTKGLKLMELACKQVEKKLCGEANKALIDSVNENYMPGHIATMINDLLYEHCIAVVVTPNSDDVSCFRGMECAQFVCMEKVYNIGILLKPEGLDEAKA